MEELQPVKQFISKRTEELAELAGEEQKLLQHPFLTIVKQEFAGFDRFRKVYREKEALVSKAHEHIEGLPQPILQLQALEYRQFIETYQQAYEKLDAIYAIRNRRATLDKELTAYQDTLDDLQDIRADLVTWTKQDNPSLQS